MEKLMSGFWKAAFVVVMLLAITFGKLIGHAAGKPSNAELLENLATQANKTLPMMLDSETRLDPVTAIGGERMIYKYTLVNYSFSQLTPANLAAINKQTVSQTCANQTKNLLAKNVELEFQYNSNDGARVLDLVIRPRACIFDPYLGGYSVSQELNCKETGGPSVVVAGRRLKPVECTN